MTSSSSEPIEVEATPIDSEIVTQDSIHRQLADLSRRASDVASRYKPHPIADRQDHKESKKARGELNKAAETLKGEGRAITARVDAWSAGVRGEANRISQGLRDLAGEYDVHVKNYEDGLLQERMDLLRRHYEEFAPMLALPMEGFEAAHVPFGMLWNSFAKARGWGKITVSDAKAIQSLEEVVSGIARDEASIDRLVSDADRTDVKTVYFRTLDMGKAMARIAELAEGRAKTAVMEAERAAWQAAQSPDPQPEPEPQPERAPYEPPRIVPGAPVAPPHAPRPVAAPQAPRPVDSHSTMTREQFEEAHQAIEGRPAPMPPRPVAVAAPSPVSTWLFFCRCTAQQAAELEALATRIGVGRRTCHDAGTTEYVLTPKPTTREW